MDLVMRSMSLDSLQEDSHISIAIRTAWPPLNHPLSDQPDTSTMIDQVLVYDIKPIRTQVLTHRLDRFVASDRCE